MYLLQASTDQAGFFFVIGWIVSLFILYLIIKAAVRAGTEGLRFQLRLQNNLKIQEMLKDGQDTEVKKAFEETKMLRG